MFTKLQKQVQSRFQELVATGHLFYIGIDRDEIWSTYLSGWSDPVQRQEHNCNCCKSFLRQYAGIVAIKDNKLMSIWDVTPDEKYALAIKAVRDYVLSRPITDIFRNPFAKLGVLENRDKEKNIIWNHYQLEAPKTFVVSDTTIDTVRAQARDLKQVFKRGLDELTIDSTETVLELIAQGSIYRGNEHKPVLDTFLKLQKEYAKVPVGLRDNYAWITSQTNKLTIRNSAIGTLLVDLSEGVDLDGAVRKFEKMVAPENYKRPTALVTPRMVEEAKIKITELGYLESLDRRFALESDMSADNMLFIDKSSMLSDVFDDMKKDVAVNPKTFSKIEEIGIEKFISDVLPTAKAVHLLLENGHLPRFVSLLTAKDPLRKMARIK